MRPDVGRLSGCWLRGRPDGRWPSASATATTARSGAPCAVGRAAGSLPTARAAHPPRQLPLPEPSSLAHSRLTLTRSLLHRQAGVIHDDRGTLVREGPVERSYRYAGRRRHRAGIQIGIGEQPVFDVLHRGPRQRCRELFAVDDLIVQQAGASWRGVSFPARTVPGDACLVDNEDVSRLTGTDRGAGTEAAGLGIGGCLAAGTQDVWS